MFFNPRISFVALCAVIVAAFSSTACVPEDAGTSFIIVHLDSQHTEDAECELQVNVAPEGQAFQWEVIDSINLAAGGSGTVAEQHPTLDSIDPLVDPVYVECITPATEAEPDPEPVGRPVEALESECSFYGDGMDCNFLWWDPNSSDEE